MFSTEMKKQWLKVFCFVTLIYMIYDGVYMFSNSKRLVLAYSKISSSILPMVALHNDVLLIILIVAVLFLFNRRQFITVFSIETRQEIIGLVAGLLIFLAAVVKFQPSSSIEAYQIIHLLVTVAMLEELVFRGFILNWLIDMGCGNFSYLISGMLWGAVYGFNPIIIGGIAPLSALVPVIFWGMVVGTAAGVIYQRTGSLWFVIYLHAALSLL